MKNATYYDHIHTKLNFLRKDKNLKLDYKTRYNHVLVTR